MQELEALDLQGRSTHIIEVHRQLTGYVRNNVHRMDYPSYVRNGWQIGSGVIESACKRVIGHRMKCGGMRWFEPGTNALAYARSLYLSTDHRCNFSGPTWPAGSYRRLGRTHGSGNQESVSS